MHTGLRLSRQVGMSKPQNKMHTVLRLSRQAEMSKLQNAYRSALESAQNAYRSPPESASGNVKVSKCIPFSAWVSRRKRPSLKIHTVLRLSRQTHWVPSFFGRASDINAFRFDCAFEVTSRLCLRFDYTFLSFEIIVILRTTLCASWRAP